MTPIWKVTHIGCAEPTYHDTPELAERERRRLEAAQPGVRAVVYRLDVEEAS